MAAEGFTADRIAQLSGITSASAPNLPLPSKEVFIFYLFGSPNIQGKQANEQNNKHKSRGAAGPFQKKNEPMQ